MRLVGSGLRVMVVTLDPARSASRSDSPAALLRGLGHDVNVVGYDLAELDPRAAVADVAVVEAGEHLEIGRHAIRHLRQRPARDKRPGAPLQVRYGDVMLDCEMRQAYEGGKSLGLTPYEFQLLRFLADRVGRVFTRQELLSRVWGYRHVGRVRTVDTHVLNLRAKLGELGERLQSVRGMGYKLQRPDAPIDGPSALAG